MYCLSLHLQPYLSMPAGKALARLHGCPAVHQPSLLANLISSKSHERVVLIIKKYVSGIQTNHIIEEVLLIEMIHMSTQNLTFCPN